MLYPRNRIKYTAFIGAVFLYVVGFFVSNKRPELDKNIFIVFFAALLLIALGKGKDVRARGAVSGIIISSFYFPLFLLTTSFFFNFSISLREYYYMISWVFAFGFLASLFNSGAAIITFSQAFCFYFYKNNEIPLLKMLLKLDPVVLERLSDMSVKQISDFCLVVGAIWFVFFAFFHLFGFVTGAKMPIEKAES